MKTKEKPIRIDEKKIIANRVLNWLYENEIISSNPLSELKIRVEHKQKFEFVSISDIHKIENMNFENLPDNLKLVRDCFLFMIYTGTEYQGIKDLRFNEHIQEYKGRLCLIQNRLKTGVERFVPLDDRAISIIKKYKLDNQMPVLSNKTMNQYLKLIQISCGILTKLHTHLGRHTFAHDSLNNKGRSVEATAVAMGCDVRNVLRYATLKKNIAIREF